MVRPVSLTLHMKYCLATPCERARWKEELHTSKSGCERMRPFVKVIFSQPERDRCACVCRCVWVMSPARLLAQGWSHKSVLVISIAVKFVPGSWSWYPPFKNNVSQDCPLTNLSTFPHTKHTQQEMKGHGIWCHVLKEIGSKKSFFNRWEKKRS